MAELAPRLVRSVGPKVAAAAGLVVIGRLSTMFAPVVLLGGVGLLALAVLALRSPRTVALGTLLLFLPFGGLLRRMTNSYAASIDMLTLVGPVVAAVCLVVLFHGQRQTWTPLSKTVTAMLALGVVQIINPAQGRPIVGLVGAGLFVGPLIWFYVGQQIGDSATLDSVIRAIRVLVVVAALYGVKQLLFGFTGFEERWIASRTTTYAALDISGKIRPFSTFASGAEYAYFLALGAVLFTGWRRDVPRAARVAIVVALLVACFYAGSRTIFVVGTMSTIAVALAHRIRRLGRALAVCILIGLAGIALLRLVPLSSDTSTAANIRNRTVAGLANPFDRKASTLGLHIDSFTSAMWEGIRTPLGHGAALVNLAGRKLGTQQVSGEHDIPNVLLAYGWAGGALLIVLVTQVYRLVGAVVRERRRDLIGTAIFVLGIFGTWFAGELYLVSALIWFFLGSIDRQMDLSSRPRDIGDAQEPKQLAALP